MSDAQASETSHQPKFSPYPLFLYAIVSSLVSWMCLQDYVGVVFLLPGYFCAQVTLLGIIAGMVGRHWLHGMALSMGLQTVICALAYALDTVNTKDDASSMIFLQYSVLTVVLPAIPTLLMRNLQSWRLVIDPMPHKSNSIQGLLLATTFVAMITTSAIQSYTAIPFNEVRSGRGHESFLQGIRGTRNLVHYFLLRASRKRSRNANAIAD